MKTQLTALDLTTSIWQFLQSIDEIINQPLPLATRLEKTNDLLLEALDIDAIWFLTIGPLPPLICGTARTPLTMAPDAKVYLCDCPTPVATHWSASPILKHVITYKTPIFFEPDTPSNNSIDSDLGDALFQTFEVLLSAVIPLATDNSTLGVLAIGNYIQTQTQFSEELQDFLFYIGKHLAKNLQNTHLLEYSQHHSDTLITLNHIAQTITSSLDIDDVIQRTMVGINRILDVEAGSLLLVDEDTEELYFKITLRGENMRVTSYRLQKGEGIAGWVVVNNKPAIVNNPTKDKRFTAKIDRAIGFKTQSVLCVPLIVQGRPIGALELLNKRRGYFNEDDQKLLISMAASLGIALKNAILYEDSQERIYINEVLNEITAVISAGRGLSETAKIIVKQFHRLFTFDHISVSLLDDAKEHIRQWTFSEYGSIEYKKQSVPLEGSELAQIIQDRKGFLAASIPASKSKSSLQPDNKLLAVEAIKSKIVVPLAAQDTPYGSLTLGSRQANSYAKNDFRLLEQLSPQLAIAIDKALLIDTMEQRTSELHLLNKLSEMLVSTTDIELIVDRTLNMLPRLLPGDVQGLIVAGDKGAYAGVAIPYNFKREQKTVADMFNTFLEMGEGEEPSPLISSKRIAGNMPVNADWEPVTALSLPILTRHNTTGLMYFASGKEEIFGDNVLRIASLIVSQISSTLANAHLFHQVEQERARLAAILASITDAVLVVNRNGRIVLDNPAAREVINVDEPQTGRLLTESTNLQMLINLFESAMQGSTPSGEIELDDGRTFFASLSPVATGSKNVTGWVATMQDVSHFKELNQLKNEFVSSVSHDLRSPLSTILLAVNLVAEAGEVNEDQRELLNAVDRQVRAMGDLIDDILDIGKIDAGLEMEMELCSIGPIIEDVATTLLPQATDKTIELTHNIDQNLPPILANTTRLQQVFFNLVGNAIKYTPNSGKVAIKAYPQDDEVRIQVIDNGMGIPPADQPHIFEKFYRVHGEHMTDIKGTGLGLAITKGIVEKHQGRIWLESVFGKGSTFTVALPFHNGDIPTRCYPENLL